jgi:hypothetical protein
MDEDCCSRAGVTLRDRSPTAEALIAALRATAAALLSGPDRDTAPDGEKTNLRDDATSTSTSTQRPR